MDDQKFDGKEEESSQKSQGNQDLTIVDSISRDNRHPE